MQFILVILICALLVLGAPVLFICLVEGPAQYKVSEERLSYDEAIGLIGAEREHFNISAETVINLRFDDDVTPRMSFEIRGLSRVFTITGDPRYLNSVSIRHEMYHVCRVAKEHAWGVTVDSRINLMSYLYVEEPRAALYVGGFDVGC